MNVLIDVPLLLVSVILSGMFAGLETGLYTTSRLRLYLDDQAGLAAAKHARRLLGRMPRLLAVLLIGNNLVNYAASFAAQDLLRALGVRQTELIGTLMLSPALFILGEAAPKRAFARARERLLYPAMPALMVAHALLAPLTGPVVALTAWLQRVVARRSGRVPRARDEVLSSGVAEGLLTPFQQRVADGVMALRTRTAGQEGHGPEDFPRAQLGRSGVQLPAGCREPRALVLSHEGDEIVGWVPLAQVVGPGRTARRADLRPVVRVGESTTLDRVYVLLDRARTPFALLPDGRVVDLGRLRERIMGLELPEAVATSPQAP